MTEQQVIQAKSLQANPGPTGGDASSHHKKTLPPYFHYENFLASYGSPLFPIRVNVISKEKRMRIVDSFLWDLRTSLCGDQHDVDTSIALTAQQLASSILSDLDVQGMNRTVRHFSGRVDLWSSEAEQLIQRQIQEQLVEAHSIWQKALAQRKQLQLEEELYQSRLAEYHVQLKKLKFDQESIEKTDDNEDKSPKNDDNPTEKEKGDSKDESESRDKEQEGQGQCNQSDSTSNKSSKSTKDLDEPKSKEEASKEKAIEKSTEEKSEQDSTLGTEQKQNEESKAKAQDAEPHHKGGNSTQKKVPETKADVYEDKASISGEADRNDPNEFKAEGIAAKESSSAEPMDIGTTPSKETTSKESEELPFATKNPVPPLKKRKRSSAHIVQIKLRMSVNGIRIHDDFQYDCSMAHLYSPMDMAKDLAKDLNLNEEAMQAVTLEILEQIAMFTGEPKPREKQVPFGWGEDAQILLRTVEERHKAWKEGQAPKSPAVALMMPSSGREISPFNTSAAWELDNKVHVTNIAYLVSQQKP